MNIIEALENLSDDAVEMAIIGQSIDTFPSRYGFPERQVSATNVPAFRKVAVELVKMVEKDYRARLVAMPHVKGHTIAAVVNDMRDTAIKFHDTQQLRERMRGCIEPLLVAAPVQAVPDGAGRGYSLGRSIIHECPALVLPQSFIQKLGGAAQIIPLRGMSDEAANQLVSDCNSTAPVQALWVSTADRMPEPETPVLIVLNGEIRIGALNWETPGYEDSYDAFLYWDDPHDDGQDWQLSEITHWMPLPDVPAPVQS